jgi:transcriptional antiterminator NusG
MNDQNQKNLEALEHGEQAQDDLQSSVSGETDSRVEPDESGVLDLAASKDETKVPELTETTETTEKAEMEEEETDLTAGEDGEVDDSPELVNPNLKWYVVHTYSGYENKAKLALDERIKRDGLEEDFGEIMIPTEEVVEMSKGKRRTSKRKFLPGYILVQMNLHEKSWYAVKSTPKITGFVGNSLKPSPVPDVEIRRITSQMAEGSTRLKPKVVFEKGDSVRVVDGPFINFNGSIDEVDSERGKLRVLVSIFGRATPVEMDFVQVEKT